jgi:cell division protein FtsB
MLATSSISARHPRQARLVIGAALLALFGLLCALCDPRGVRQLRRLRHDLARQQAANHALEQQTSELSRSVRALSSGRSAAAEKAVREQLGFVRDDEVVFKFE